MVNTVLFAMYIRYYMAEDHVISNIGIYIRYYMVQCYVISKIHGQRVMYIRYYMAEDHVISNIDAYTVVYIRYYMTGICHVKSNIDGLLIM